MVDYTEDILAYLRERHDRLMPMMTVVHDLTKRIKDYRHKPVVFGQILSDLSRLIREKKVIRYRQAPYVQRSRRSSQGVVRISQKFV
jgi:hypothetical protein